MNKIATFIRYFTDFLRYGQVRLFLASLVYVLAKKSFIETRIFRGKLGYFLHRKGSIDFQFGNYAYEWNVKKIMNKYHSNYNIFIDVGANIGTYTIMLANRGMRSFSFEPAKENFKALNINVMLNNLEDIATIYNVGLSDENTTASFVFDPLNTGASHMEIIPAEDEQAEKRGILTEIQLVRLDDMIEKMNIKSDEKLLIKIDVEGNESQVLLGGEAFIQRFAQVMIVMESVHSGEEKLKSILDKIAVFEYLPVDALNFAAIKVRNHN